MAIIGRGALLALTMLLAGCAGLDRSGSTAGEYPDEVYGRGGWNTERDPYWSARDPYYSPYGWSGFGPYGYWGYPGWWGPPVYYVYPERDVPTAEPAGRGRLRPLQERMLRIAPLPLPRWVPPAPVRLPSQNRPAQGDLREPLAVPAGPGRWSKPASPALKPPSVPVAPVVPSPSAPARDRGVFPPDRSEQPDSSPDRRPWSRPPPALKPPPMPEPPIIRSPSMRERQPESRPESPYQRRPWRHRDADGE